MKFLEALAGFLITGRTRFLVVGQRARAVGLHLFAVVVDGCEIEAAEAVAGIAAFFQKGDRLLDVLHRSVADQRRV